MFYDLLLTRSYSILLDLALIELLLNRKPTMPLLFYSIATSIFADDLLLDQSKDSYSDEYHYGRFPTYGTLLTLSLNKWGESGYPATNPVALLA